MNPLIPLWRPALIDPSGCPLKTRAGRRVPGSRDRNMLIATHLVGFGVGGGPSIDGTFYHDIVGLGLADNLVLCLDAGDALSYTSGQKWLDRSGGGHDFFRGADGSASTDDPTFNGTPGNKSSSEYWSFDGGDFFRYDTTNETWMHNLHKNNAAFTILIWLYLTASSNRGIFGGAGTTPDSNTIGVNLAMLSSVPLIEIGKGGGGLALGKTATTAMGNNAWHMVGVSLDEAVGAAGGFFYLDGAYNQVSGSDTFDATYSSPSTSNASFTFELGSRGDAASALLSGSRIAGVFIWMTALTKVSLDAIWARQRERFGV